MACHQVSQMSLQYRMLVMDLVHEESNNTSILVTDTVVCITLLTNIMLLPIKAFLTVVRNQERTWAMQDDITEKVHIITLCTQILITSKCILSKL